MLQTTFVAAIISLLLVPGTVSARVYKWTDEKGTLVFSNIPPTDAKKVKDMEVVLEDEKLPAPTAHQSAQAEILRTQQQLMERIYNLERQLQAQQQYAMSVPPPPVAYNYDNSYSAPYSPFGYTYPYFVVPAGIVRPIHRFAAPRFASPGRFASFHHGGGVSRARR